MAKLQETLDFLIKEYPESENIIKPFGAFLLIEEEIIQSMQEQNIATLGDKADLPVKFKKFPITQKENLIILNPLIKTLKISFPHLEEEVKILEKPLKLKAFHTLCEKYLKDKSKKVNLIEDYLKSLTQGEKPALEAKVLKDKHAELTSILELLLTRTCRIVLSHVLCEIPVKDESKFTKTCPYCNGKPSTSVIHQKEGARELLCTDCGRFWRFSRTACPNCLHEEENNLQMIYIDDRDKERAMHCNACNHYIIEVDIRDRYFDLKHIEAFTLALSYLDIIMLERKAEPI